MEEHTTNVTNHIVVSHFDSIFDSALIVKSLQQDCNFNVRARERIRDGKFTIIDVLLAVGARPARSAFTGVVIRQTSIDTGGSVLARVVGKAIVDVPSAVGPRPARRAFTLKAVHAIGAGTSVLARVGAAIVDVRLTVGSRIARIAATGVVIWQTNTRAGASVLALVVRHEHTAVSIR